MAREKLGNILGAGVRDLNPAYFALVMATGIVSIASYLLGMEPVAWSLFWLNIFAYLVLWILTIFRLARYFPQLKSDLTSHVRGPGFFTIIAGTCVLGSQFIILGVSNTLAMVLWIVGLVLWPVIMYSFFGAVMLREEKPPLENGINGAWLIAIVATQSISILGTLLNGMFANGSQALLFFTLTMYLLGGMLYILVISLIFYRFTFFRVAPEAITPPYWINMGAVAITTLAGATLMLNAQQGTLLNSLLPFLQGFTLFFWAIGTWWIPLLFIFGYWLHLYKRFPIKYNPQYWGMVFPLGMYTACTFQLAKALELDFLFSIPNYFIYIALVAWLATFWGLTRRLVTTLSPAFLSGTK